MLKRLRNFLAPAETRSLGNPTDEEIAVLTGASVGSSGVSLSAALTVPAVQCAIRLISEAAASLEVRVERKDGDTWQQDRDHAVAVLLADQPNSWTSTYELIRDLVARALTDNRGGVAFVNRVRGEVREIIGYEPSSVTIHYTTDGRQEPAYRINELPVAAASIVHLRSPFSRSPLSLAVDAIGLAKTLETHGRNLFKNASRPGGVIEMEKSLGDEGLKKMKAAWRAAHDGADNTGKTAILWDGAKFKTLALDSTDAQFLENRTFQILEIARAFRVPPSMLFELTRATWSNSEQMGKEFLTYCLEPWLKALEGAMRRALFTDEERKTYRVIFDRDDLTRADLTARATAISSLVSAKVLNPNEARGWLDLGPYEGGDEYGNPHINPNAPNGPANQPPPLQKPAEEPTNEDA